MPSKFESHSVKVRFGDFEIDCLSRLDLVRMALDDCVDPPSLPRLVFDANGHALSLAKTDARYRECIAQADVIHADGGFLVTLSRLLGLNVIPERSATTDMIHDLASVFSETSFSFYLMGGEERVNSECSQILKRDYPGLRIVGRRDGFFSVEQERRVVDAINAVDPDILWVGLGKPKEQDFCIRWRSELKARWIVTCGGCFNYVTGDYRRAPEFIQRYNLEWLHRMVTNPRKLFWRYAVTNPHALWIALRERGALLKEDVT